MITAIAQTGDADTFLVNLYNWGTTQHLFSWRVDRNLWLQTFKSCPAFGLLIFSKHKLDIRCFDSNPFWWTSLCNLSQCAHCTFKMLFPHTCTHSLPHKPPSGRTLFLCIVATLIIVYFPVGHFTALVIFHVVSRCQLDSVIQCSFVFCLSSWISLLSCLFLVMFSKGLSKVFFPSHPLPHSLFFFS